MKGPLADKPGIQDTLLQVVNIPPVPTARNNI